jgi:dolichyl-phosphate-mannose-protein mannosyltransferase
LGLKQYPAIGQAAAVGFLAIAITVFTVYAPLAYGNAWTKSQCNTVKLFSTWDWDCNNFLDSVSAAFSFAEILLTIHLSTPHTMT